MGMGMGMGMGVGGQKPAPPKDSFDFVAQHMKH